MVTIDEPEETARRRTAFGASRRHRNGTHGAQRRAKDAMERLVAIAADETRAASIDDLLLEFQGTLDEFHALSQPLRSANPQYDAMYQRMVGKFLECYPTLRLNVVYLNLGKYSVDRWGPVYWRFFHLSAILLLELFANHQVDDVLDYPTLLYNVDTVLPCPTCAFHYQQIKRGESVLAAVKEMSFARLMNGARYFHNLVTQHQNELPEFQQRPPRPPFTVLDYAERYGCLEEVPDDLVKTATYVRGWVDWQPPLHRRLTLYHAMRRSIPYALASRHVKRVLYEEAAVEPNYPSRDELLRSIAEGMVGAVPHDFRPTLEPYAERFYATYPAETQAVAEYIAATYDEKPDSGSGNNSHESNDDPFDRPSEIRRSAIATLAALHRITDGEYGRVSHSSANGRVLGGGGAPQASSGGDDVDETTSSGSDETISDHGRLPRRRRRRISPTSSADDGLPIPQRRAQPAPPNAIDDPGN